MWEKNYEYNVIWWKDKRLVKSSDSRIALISFQKDSLEKAKIVTEIEFKKGVYIIEFSSINEGHKKSIYVGESEDVWKRISEHIEGKSNLDLQGKTIDNVSIIYSTDSYIDFEKPKMRWFEKSLIDYFKKRGLILNNNNRGYGKEIKAYRKDRYASELENIKRALYFAGKDYLVDINSENEKSLKLIIPTKSSRNASIIVHPITSKKSNVKIINGKFEYYFSKSKIKVFKETIFQGRFKSETNLENIQKRYENHKNNLRKHYIDPIDKEYKLEVIKDFEMKPSALCHFTKAGQGVNGWEYWKDENGKTISWHRNNPSKSEKPKETTKTSVSNSKYPLIKEADFSKNEIVINSKGKKVKTCLYYYYHMEENVKNIFQNIINEIKKWTNCKMTYRSNFWYFEESKRFVEFYFHKNKIVVQINIHKYQEKNNVEIRDVSGIGKYGKLNQRLEIYNNKNLGDVLALIKLSYENSKEI